MNADESNMSEVSVKSEPGSSGYEPTPVRFRRRRGVLVVFLIVLVWYGFVLSCPEAFRHHPSENAMRAAVYTYMLSHGRCVHGGIETFGDRSSWGLSKIARTTELPANGYRLRVFRSNGGQPVAIVAYPRRFQTYFRNGLQRLVFLDFQKWTYYSILLTRDGVLCVNTASGYCDASPPGSDLPKPGENGWGVRWTIQEDGHLNPVTATSTAPAR